MYYPDKQNFIKLAEKGNVIPVYRDMPVGDETPLTVFSKVDAGEYAYLLESVEGEEHMARYSFIGSEPRVILRSKGKSVSMESGGKTETYAAKKDPIEEMRLLMSVFRFVEVDGLPRFCGGLVGYMSYDMVRFIERIPNENPDDLDIPDMQMVLADTIFVFDHVEKRIKVVANALVEGDAGAAYEDACKKIDALVKKLEGQAPRRKKTNPLPARGGKEFESNFFGEDFYGIVKKAKEYIRAGEVIQLVLSQRLKCHTESDAFSIYKALREINPSPYMFYLKFGRCRMIGSSPEILVRCEKGLVEVRPIAGTRKRGASPEEDKRLEKELLADPKERAEHIMLLDLGRNDIGRVCEYSSVKVGEIMRIEKYSHVMHIVSDVTGTLQKDKDIYDLLRATFPAGTVTGAPKVRAMELIDELENVRRGPYAGCVGYISFSGNIDMCITIRTAVMLEDTVYIQAGAGIVLDSDPEKEYQETMNKAKAMKKAVEAAEGAEA